MFQQEGSKLFFKFVTIFQIIYVVSLIPIFTTLIFLNILTAILNM
jgi:hypothetical protein